jgi:hypothetical protein
MTESRFHLTLTVGLAACMGALTVAAFSSNVAIGYPSVGAVSSGANPVQSWGGTMSGSGLTVFTAPVDMDIVITDVHFSCSYMCDTRVTMIRSDAKNVGTFYISGGYGSNYDSMAVSQQFSSGIKIPAGQSLAISPTSGISVAYTLSGYEATP